MTSIIKLHAISGAMDESPPCYILQVDDFRILLDCGWDENFDPEFMKELRRYGMLVPVTLCCFGCRIYVGYEIGILETDLLFTYTCLFCP
jgi:cleavage and polyadenylation specificity factor subunit 2